jgi:serpin B
MASTAAPTLVDLELPKFTFDTAESLEPALNSLGMTSLFAQDSVDLSGTPAQTPLQVTRMHVDRPFLFIIRDTMTGQILFLGQVSSPQG